MGKADANMRQPLQQLPSTPLNKRPTLITNLPAELLSPSASMCPSKPSGTAKNITPPTTPVEPRQEKVPVTQLLGLRLLGLENSGSSQEQPTGDSLQGGVGSAHHIRNHKTALTWEEAMPQPCAMSYKILKPGSSEYEEYGRGTWSAVYRGLPAIVDSNAKKSQGGVLTPPTSPTISEMERQRKSLIAIKSPIRKDAYGILDNEARILTYLHQYTGSDDYIVPFQGYDEPSHSIILGAVPLSLDAYTKDALSKARINISTRTMLDPIIGKSEWAGLARQLISGLAYIRNMQCVHGDIKPANILLRIRDGCNIQPLYCDFSSSHVCPPDANIENIEEVSAVTTDYTSPELLQSFYRRNGGRAVATFASDVFALGVTLLVSATGESPFSAARMEVQKLTMAKEGQPLMFARTGEQASRIMKGKMVEMCLKGSLEKDVDSRITVDVWKSESEQLLAEWR